MFFLVLGRVVVGMRLRIELKHEGGDKRLVLLSLMRCEMR